MAKFLIVSCLAESIGLAIRLLGEGHQVLYYIHEQSEKDCGDGFIEKVNSWRDHVEESDVVFFDDCDQKVEGESAYKSSAWAAEVRKKYPGKMVIGGGSPDVAKLENDRIFGQQVLQEYGVNVAPMHQFNSFEEGRRFVEEQGGAWALKHNNQVDRDAAGVFKTPEDMIEFLDFLEKNWGDLGNGQPVDYVLQEKADGVELACTCFYDGQRFRSEACYLNQEYKKELDGDEGRSTGQMGEIGLMMQNPRLFQETLAKVEPWFADKGYIGFIDLNCILGDNGEIVPLEWTSRPGYPTFFSFLEMLTEPSGEWLIRMASQDPNPIQTFDNMVECTLVLATGTFPDQHPTRNKLTIVHGLEDVGLRHVWLCEARFEDGKVRGAGDMGYVADITAHGQSIPEAVTKAYDTIEKIDVVPYKKIRQDIGNRSMKDFQKLAQGGWLG